MNTPRTTPRPWWMVDGRWVSHGSTDMAMIRHRPDDGNDCPTLPVADANARVIAAAPDLLRALKALVYECESMGRASHTNAVINAAHRAIAHAEGH